MNTDGLVKLAQVPRNRAERRAMGIGIASGDWRARTLALVDARRIANRPDARNPAQPKRRPRKRGGDTSSHVKRAQRGWDR